MTCSKLRAALIMALGLFFFSGISLGDVVPHEPTPDGAIRPLRTDYVTTWYIYNDSLTDGILNPNDTAVETFQNWWTPVSAHTQHNYGDHQGLTAGDDWISGPMNFATSTLPSGHPDKNNSSYNYWLPRDKNAIHFYMSYSQFDNIDWAMSGNSSTAEQIVRQRNMYRNGYTLGWVTHDYQDSEGNYAYDQTSAGFVEMDIFVHEGEHTLTVSGWGKSRSNPQVAVSNDIHPVYSEDNVGAGGQFQPPQFDEATQSYSWDENRLRMEANGFTASNLTSMVDSMEQKELDPYNLPGGAWSPIYANRTPEAILADGIKDHSGLDYIYEDAFMDRSNYVQASTDGGVIAGLSGWSEYDEQVNNWGDQQVIRIDVSEEMLLTGENGGNIDEIVFYDFGDSVPGSTTSDQVDPRAIVIGVDLGRTVAQGQLYLKDPVTGDPVVYFPENRIYIARVNVVPEPGMMVLLGLGGIGLLLRKRR